MIPMSAWAEDDIPSKKLLLKGSNSLSNAELLSIVIGNGIEGENSLGIAMNLLSHCGHNLCELWKLSLHDIKQVRGIGEKKAIQIMSIFALARRRNLSEAMHRDKIESSRDAFQIFRNAIGDPPYEEFWIVMLDRSNRMIRRECISEGGISGTVVDPKKIFKIALDHHACALIMGHNHPSGNCRPSDADKNITRKITQAGILLEIQVLDHIIVAHDAYYSFADEGII